MIEGWPVARWAVAGGASHNHDVMPFIILDLRKSVVCGLQFFLLFGWAPVVSSVLGRRLLFGHRRGPYPIGCLVLTNFLLKDD